MLKLKRLQILGFKSFCDRTELKFHGDGVAAIIGPNGCGKSNISDAISWVLGEQSAKTCLLYTSPRPLQQSLQFDHPRHIPDAGS